MDYVDTGAALETNVIAPDIGAFTDEQSCPRPSIDYTIAGEGKALTASNGEIEGYPQDVDALGVFEDIGEYTLYTVDDIGSFAREASSPSREQVAYETKDSAPQPPSESSSNSGISQGSVASSRGRLSSSSQPGECARQSFYDATGMKAGEGLYR